jgi:Uma2 family endonuclease
MTTTTRMTAEQYFAVSVEGDRTQLVEGELVVNEPPLEHVLVQRNLLFVLTTWTQAAPGRGIAFPPVDVVVDEHNVFGPDVVWLREERVPNPLAGRLQGLPDLAVEVRSPSTWRYDVGKKKLAYERSGLPELWLVDNVAASVLVYRRSDAKAPAFDVELELAGSDELTSPLLPGFSVPVERLFRR